MRVLIVERSEATRAALRLFIEIGARAGLVAEAANLDEAAAAIALHRPDAIILDWEMPGARSLLAADPSAAMPPVIALSSRPEARRDALLAGAGGFVCRCDPPERLAAALESLGESLEMTVPPEVPGRADLAAGLETR